MMRNDFIIPCHVSKLILYANNTELHLNEENFDSGDLCVLIVTGETVGSRNYDISDSIVNRIISNEDLYISIHGEDSIDYIRKSIVDLAICELNCRVIGVVVCRDIASVNITEEVDLIRKRKLSLLNLKSDLPLLNYLILGLLKKISLPLLLFYFIILIANFIFHSSLTEKLTDIRFISAKESVAVKKYVEITQAQQKLYNEYLRIPSIDIVVASDKIASCIPKCVRLETMVFNEPKTRKRYSVPDNQSVLMLSGFSVTAEDIMGFIDILKNELNFSKVNIIKLENNIKKGLFQFELELIL